MSGPCSLGPASQSIRSMPMMPQSMPVMPNSVPQDGEEDHLLIPHRIEDRSQRCITARVSMSTCKPACDVLQDMGDGVSRRPPQNQQKPPAWHAIEAPTCGTNQPVGLLASPLCTSLPRRFQERPHLLEVELQELELHPDAPDLQPGAPDGVLRDA